MIRVCTAQTPKDLEVVLNALKAEGFALCTLAYRGYEAVAVFEIEPISDRTINEARRIVAASVHVDPKDLNWPESKFKEEAALHADHPSNWQPPKATETPKPAPVQQNSFKRRGR